MSVLTSQAVIGPFGKEESCAKFEIPHDREKFTISDVAVIGSKYIFRCWIKSDSDGQIKLLGTSINTSNEWQECVILFTADNIDIVIDYEVAGTYYIYHPKLETGTNVTDWTPAPEDAFESIDIAITDLNNAISEQISNIEKSFADLKINTNSIVASVKDVSAKIDDVDRQVFSNQEKISSLELTSYNMNLQFKNISDNGVTKVNTETGFTFDKDGMMVDATDSTTKTQITTDGMTVYKKESDTQNAILEATSEGVNATNLHANTYLIVGKDKGRSRFEDYGSNRTGCFWIGG